MKNSITVQPNICNGRLIIANTRITVQTTMEFLDAGDLIEEYPSLTKEDINHRSYG